VASIKKRSDGTYRARFRNPAGREHARHFSKRVEAQKWLDEQTASLVRGEYVDPRRGRLKFGEWAARWMEGRVHLKPRTIASYRSLLTTRILPTWEEVPLLGVANADVVAWVASMRSVGLSASRVRQSYHLFSTMLDAAVRDRRLASNPANGVDLPRLPRKERRYLDHAQLAELALACGTYRPLVLVLGYCGLRWGEAAALRVGRVDTMRGRIEVVEAVTEVNGEAVFGTPKTHQVRSVPVPAFLRDLLAQHVAGLDEDALVFSAPRGGVIRVGNFRRGYFDRAARDIGVDGLVPHELRHSSASLAIAAGASVKGVQAMLGHSSATLTLDRYGHLFGDELDAVADGIDAAAREFADFSRTERGGTTRPPRRVAR
jgi:integrase